ncbi:Mss4-like protein [Biscogniauxia mediterranea]|nr:Mss4-like protein [Biscogniauxia mediterranea]
MTPLPGSCYCGLVRYTIALSDPAAEAQARTSLCHCRNCKKFTGGACGVTTRVPRSAFRFLLGSNQQQEQEQEQGNKQQGQEHEQEQGGNQKNDYIRVHESDNGSGTTLHREFCGVCGSGILEYGANAGDYVYVFYGTLEDHARGQVEPRGEFFCRLRDPWMPEIEGLFQKQEIHE